VISPPVPPPVGRPKKVQSSVPVPMPEGEDVEFEVLPRALKRLDESNGVVSESVAEAIGAGTVGPLTAAWEVPGADAVPVEEPLAGVDAVPVEEPLAGGWVAVAVARSVELACGLLGAAAAGFELAGEPWLPAGDFDAFAGPAGPGEVNGEPASTTPGPDS
jgi:hypothetical protein